MNIREILQGRTIVSVAPLGNDGDESDFEDEILLTLDDGTVLTISSVPDIGGGSSALYFSIEESE